MCACRNVQKYALTMLFEAALERAADFQPCERAVGKCLKLFATTGGLHAHQKKA